MRHVPRLIPAYPLIHQLPRLLSSGRSGISSGGLLTCSEPRRRNDARGCAPSKEPQRNANNRPRGRGRARGRCRFAVDPCRTALRYLCGRGSTASPITATTWGTTPPRIRALPLQIALENSREKNWERRTGPVSRLNEQRVYRRPRGRRRPRRRRRSSGRGDRASSAILPSVFAPSRGTRSRRISETLRHSLATKRIERALPFFPPLLFFLGPDLVHPHFSVPLSPRTTRS